MDRVERRVRGEREVGVLGAYPTSSPTSLHEVEEGCLEGRAEKSGRIGKEWCAARHLLGLCLAGGWASTGVTV
jgi:hypothetical protein